MGTTTKEFIAALADQHRVLVIGGLAVIAYGFSQALLENQRIPYTTD